MATTKKRLNTSFTVSTINGSDTITLDSGLVTITGNLQVNGNTQQVATINSAISDNTIFLNHGTATPNIRGAAIEVDRGTAANVQLRWNEQVQYWQVTRDGINFANIAVTGTSLSASNPAVLSAIVQDPAPALGGNLDVQNYQIFSSTGKYVTINSNIAIAKTQITPAALPGNVVVFTAISGGGQSGVYVNNGVDAVSELASQVAPMKYAIIFGY